MPELGTPFVILGTFAAAVAGIVGQLTLYRDDAGKVTARARHVFILVALAAALSLIGTLLSEREGERATSERQEELLRAFWKQGAIVTAADFSVIVEFITGAQAKPPPVFFEEEWKLSVRALHPAKPVGPPNKWAERHLLARDGIAVEARDRSNWSEPQPSVDGISYTQYARFTEFQGTTGNLETLADLNGATIEVLLRGQSTFPMLEADNNWDLTETHTKEEQDVHQEAQAAERDRHKREYRDFYAGMPEEQGDFRFLASDLMVVATAYVRHQPVARVEGRLLSYRSYDEQVRSDELVKFTLGKLEADQFVSFGVSPPGSDWTSWWLIGAGLLLSIATIVESWWVVRLRDQKPPGEQANASTPSAQT